MSDERPSDVLGALPRTRPHRRSDKRAARPGQSKPAAAVTAQAVDAVQAAVTASEPTTKPKAPAKAKAKVPAKAKGPKAKAPVAAKPKAPARTKASPAPRAGTTATSVRPSEPARATSVAPPKPVTSRRGDVLGTAVQAAAELAEIGLTASARALRRAVSRLPRP